MWVKKGARKNAKKKNFPAPFIKPTFPSGDECPVINNIVIIHYFVVLSFSLYKKIDAKN